MLTVIDLFAGCGGMTEGFRSADAGFTPLAAVEWDRAAAATYATNFGADHVVWGDIASFNAPATADVVIGGPPCQGFSGLGSRDIDDPRNVLWKEYMRVVLEADPKVFVLENVDRFIRSSEFQLLMDELGHGQLRRWKFHEPAILNAADFGVPQRRQRTILIASRVGPVRFPKPTHSRLGTGGLLRWETVASAFAGIDHQTSTTELPRRHTDVFDESVPGAFKASELHFGRRPTDQSLERYDHIPPGGGRFDLPDRLVAPADWYNGRDGPAALGCPQCHHSHGVLQAGEGQIPPPTVDEGSVRESEPRDHSSRSGTPPNVSG